MFYTPQEQAYISGLNAAAVSQAQLPAALTSLEAKYQVELQQKLLQYDAQLRRNGYMLARNPITGDLTDTIVPVPKDELSVTDVAKLGKTEAETGLTQARIESEPFRRRNLEATAILHEAQAATAPELAELKRQKTEADVKLIQQKLQDASPEATSELINAVIQNPDTLFALPAAQRSKVIAAMQGRNLPVPSTKIPAAQQSQEFSAKLALDAVQNIRDITRQFPNVYGQVAGRISRWEQGWGGPIFPKGTAEAEAEQELQTSFNYLLAHEAKAVMGGRVPQQWLEMMEKTSPNITQSTAFLEGSLRAVERNAHDVIRETDAMRYRQNPGVPNPPPNPPAGLTVLPQTTPGELRIQGPDGTIGVYDAKTRKRLRIEGK